MPPHTLFTAPKTGWDDRIPYKSTVLYLVDLYFVAIKQTMTAVLNIRSRLPVAALEVVHCLVLPCNN